MNNVQQFFYYKFSLKFNKQSEKIINSQNMKY